MKDSRAIRNRLRRIEGQVRGFQRLVEEDAACVDVITQVAAAQAALRQVAVHVLDAHVRERVAQARAEDEGLFAEEQIDELLAAVRRSSTRRHEPADRPGGLRQDREDERGE